MKAVSEMTLVEKVGQVVVIGGTIGGLGDGKGIENALQVIRENKAGGFYLGYPRYQTPLDAWELHTKLQAESEIPLFICGDMETGLGYIIIDDVQRHPYLMALGAARDEALAQEIGAITGREASAIGFNWNYGPCVDVNLKKENPAAGIRAFGGEPSLVSKMGQAYIRGCQSERVICSAKHFPGHGSLTIDTHHEIGIDDSDKDTIMKVHIPPFKGAVDAGVKAIMSGHVGFPSLGSGTFPATLSKEVMTTCLRKVLGFEGLIITDSLAMKAVSDNYGTDEAIILSFLAGCDTVLAPVAWRPYETLIKAVKSGRIPEEKLDESVERILQVKSWLYPQGYRGPKKEDVKELFEHPQTGKTLRTLALKTTTLLEDKVLPFKAAARKRLFIIQERDEAYEYCPWEKDVLLEAERIIHKKEPNPTAMRISMACSEDERKGVLATAQEHEEVIFFCIVKPLIEQYAGRLSQATNQLLSDVARERALVILSLGSPYLIDDVENCAGFICTYGESGTCAQTAFKVLYGEATPGGKLPVAVSEEYPFGYGLTGDKPQTTQNN